MLELSGLIAEFRQRQVLAPDTTVDASDPEALCRDVLGFDPPCRDASLDAAGAEPEERLRRMHQVMRTRGLVPDRFDSRVAHLVMLAMLMREGPGLVLPQAMAARRSGASVHDLECVAGLAFALFGADAAAAGEEMLRAVAAEEQQGRTTGAAPDSG